MPDFGPWVTAQFDSDCDGCGDSIEEGDQVRSDGEDGWIGECCGQDEEDENLSSIREVTGRKSDA